MNGFVHPPVHHNLMSALQDLCVLYLSTSASAQLRELPSLQTDLGQLEGAALAPLSPVG